MAVSSDLRIPEKVYVKFQRRARGDEELLLGFMTPYDEDDPKFKDKKYTVDRWSNHRGEKSFLDKQAWVGYNEPMEGFEILHTVNRHRTSNKVWRIQDPRGFELEISSWNLSQMLGNVTIINGVIQNECVWCRNSNGDNWLIPTDCDAYTEAKEYTEVRNTRISLRDVNRGDIVTLHDGRSIKYLGGFYYPVDCMHSYSDGGCVSKMDTGRRYFFLVPDEDGEYTVLDSKSSIKVGNLVKEAESPLSKREAEVVANEAMRLTNSGWRPKPIFLSASKFAASDIAVVIEDYDAPADLGELLGTGEYRGCNQAPLLVADISEGAVAEGFYMLDGRSYDGYGDDREDYYKFVMYDRDAFLNDFRRVPITRRRSVRGRRGWGSTRTKVVDEAIIRKVLITEDIGKYDWKKVSVEVKGVALPVCWGTPD